MSDARTEKNVTSALLLSPLRTIAYTCIFLILTCACSGVPPATNIDEGGYSDSGVSATDATRNELDAQVEMMPDGASIEAHHDAEATPPNLCNGVYGLAEDLGQPTYSELIEVSGIAASRTRDDRYWLHNDSGHGPILYSVDGTGLGRGKLTIDVPAIDWEDIAIAQCPGQTRSCIWIADIGDNNARRQNVFVYVVPEPNTDGDHERDILATYTLTYEGGSRDAEAFFVSHDGLKMWVIEKNNDGQATVFESHTSLIEDRNIEMKSVASLTTPGLDIDKGRMVTAGDLHPSGMRLLLRVYTGIYEYNLPSPYALSALPSLQPTTVTLGPLSERQGEAVCYSDSGQDVLSISEDPDRREVQILHGYRCESED